MSETHQFKVLVTELIHDDALAGFEAFAQVDQMLIPLDHAEQEAALIAKLEEGKYDALYTRASTQCTRAVVEAGRAAGLKVIGTATMGTDHIDLQALSDFKVDLVSLRGTVAHTIPTAEHVFALMLAVSRNLIVDHVTTVKGEWHRGIDSYGHSLKGKTLGIVGLGSIGQYVANVATAGFKMNVVAYDPYAGPEAFLAVHAEEVDSLEDVISASDILTLHCMLNDETRHILSRERLALMKKSAVLINCGRGPLVDEDALVDALEAGDLAAAGLDVFDSEPLTADSRLAQYAASHDNVVLTPHAGASTLEALKEAGLVVVNRIRNILENNTWKE